MANTLTNLIPSLEVGLDTVSRELVGMIPSVTRDGSVDRAAVNQTVYSYVTPAAASANITPGVTPPDSGDQVIGNTSITISKSKAVWFRLNGEETRGLNNNGPGASNIQMDQIQQAFRTLTNEIEADLTALHVYASRAAGAAGTTPFATAGDLTAASLARKILVDNGSPTSDMSLVLDTAAGANLRGKHGGANFQGSDDMLRQGVLQEYYGMMIRESGQIVTSTAGTGSSATTDNAGYSIGDTVITLASAGTGTIVAGDVITFNGDANQYVVLSGDTDVSNGGTITLAAPGLRKAIAASATAITVVAAAARSMAFPRSAIVLAARMPALPDGGDMADDRQALVDDRSGLVFEVAQYRQFRQTAYMVGCSWGVKVIKPEHVALLLG